MNHREKVARHEASHVVIAFLSGAGILEEGIDVDAPTSREGAFGTAAVNLFVHDPNAAIDEQRNLLCASLAIICAGAASDSKLTGTPLRAALRRQAGDERVALNLLAASPLIEGKEAHERQAEEEHVLNIALALAERELAKADVWDAVEQIAQAALRAGGRLSKQQIEEILTRVFSGKAQHPEKRPHPRRRDPVPL